MNNIKRNLLLSLTILLSSTISAAPLQDFQFKSPSFNGNGYGTYVLTIENEEYSRQQAIQQALAQAQAQAAANAANTASFVVSTELIKLTISTN